MTREEIASVLQDKARYVYVWAPGDQVYARQAEACYAAARIVMGIDTPGRMTSLIHGYVIEGTYIVEVKEPAYLHPLGMRGIYLDATGALE